MNKLMEKLEKWLMPLADRITRFVFLSALGATFQILLPIIMIGAFACLGAFLDIPAWQGFVASVGLAPIFMKLQSLTLSIISLYIAVVLPFQYAQRLNLKPLGPTITTLMAYLLITPHELYTNIPETWLGYSGMFTVLITTFLVVRFCQFLENKNIYIHMPEGVPPMVEEAFKTLVPAVLVAIIAVLVQTTFEATSFGSVHQLIYTFIQAPLQTFGLSYPAYMVMQLFTTLFMFCGIHGNTILSTFSPMTLAASAENLAAFQAGTALPNIIIDSFQVFCQPGGVGGTLGLACLCAFTAKSKRLKTLGRMSIIPGIFNINEPMLFGIPILLNPLLIIPYVLTPMVCTTISYVSIAIGIVPRLNGAAVNWTMPQVVSGFLAQGWQAAVLQVVLIVIATLIWLPFFRIVDRQACEEEANGGAIE